MKPLIITGLGLLLLVLLLLRSCFDFRAYTQYESVMAQIVSASVSDEGDVLLCTNSAYLIVHPETQWAKFHGNFPPSEIDDIVVPKWTDFISGSPDESISRRFQPVKVVTGWNANLIGREEIHAKGPDAIVLRNEFASFRSARAWIQLQLLSDNPRLESYGIRVFFIELPAMRKHGVFPKPTKFMSIGG